MRTSHPSSASTASGVEFEPRLNLVAGYALFKVQQLCVPAFLALHLHVPQLIATMWLHIWSKVQVGMGRGSCLRGEPRPRRCYARPSLTSHAILLQPQPLTQSDPVLSPALSVNNLAPSDSSYPHPRSRHLLLAHHQGQSALRDMHCSYGDNVRFLFSVSHFICAKPSRCMRHAQHRRLFLEHDSPLTMSLDLFVYILDLITK